MNNYEQIFHNYDYIHKQLPSTYIADEVENIVNEVNLVDILMYVGRVDITNLQMDINLNLYLRHIEYLKNLK